MDSFAAFPVGRTQKAQAWAFTYVRLDDSSPFLSQEDASAVFRHFEDRGPLELVVSLKPQRIEVYVAWPWHIYPIYSDHRVEDLTPSFKPIYSFTAMKKLLGPPAPGSYLAKGLDWYRAYHDYDYNLRQVVLALDSGATPDSIRHKYPLLLVRWECLHPKHNRALALLRTQSGTVRPEDQKALSSLTKRPPEPLEDTPK